MNKENVKRKISIKCLCNFPIFFLIIALLITALFTSNYDSY